jgi:hypothetical protein
MTVILYSLLMETSNTLDSNGLASKQINILVESSLFPTQQANIQER